MITIISPAKTLNFKTQSPISDFSQPLFVNQAAKLVNELVKLNPSELKELMDINNGLSELNFIRYSKWELVHSTANSKQAIFAFNGEVYNGFNASRITSEQAEFAQEHLRILSGLYGILRPLDLIQPYRLEISTKISTNHFKNLYEYWTKTITAQINKELEQHSSKVLVNLASNEYSRSIQIKKGTGQIITPVFKELKGNVLKVIVVYTKKARGQMARFIVDNKIDTPEDLKFFDSDGYFFDEALSSDKEWVFTR